MELIHHMKHRNLMSPFLLQPLLYFIKTSFFLTLFFLRCFAIEDEHYQACKPISCGNIREIRYPFWVNNHQPDYCGLPNFKLDCQNDNLTIDILSQKFQVIDITSTTQVLKIARLDLWGSKCPKNFTNIDLDSDYFKYTSRDMNATFLYDCELHEDKTINISIPAMFSCYIGSELRGAYYLSSTNWGSVSDLECGINMTVPVLNVAVQSFTKNAWDVSYVLDQGFEVRWIVQDEAFCEDCSRSGGICGHMTNMTDFVCFFYDRPYSRTCGNNPLTSPTPMIDHGTGGSTAHLSKLIIGLIAAGIGALLICIILFYFRHKLSLIMPERMKKRDHDIEAVIRNNGPLSLKRYTYSDIKKMTNSFKVKLGQGGYGDVYKGNLINNCPVAVKVLNSSKGNGEEFINEVVSISRTSHVNIVSLLGFCLEGHKKALVYEFMPNGSLEKFIYNKDFESNPPLSWERLQQIAEGIARGLEYLHRGCNTRILHFDIKPNNILLDKNFCPKISDFGLAKLCSKTHSIVSMLDARGTVGYIAPEVWNRNFGGVSHKSDVYSYGMMILEMVGGRQNINTEVSHTSEIYFPHWVYKHIEVGSNIEEYGAMTTEENEIVKKMIIVGLWCIQTKPSERPPMSRVIKMLAGSTEQLQIPPKPFIFSPTRTEVESCTLSCID